MLQFMKLAEEAMGGQQERPQQYPGQGYQGNAPPGYQNQGQVNMS
jgi:hypothetical protein